MNWFRVKTFIKSLWFHINAGFPKSTQKQILYRFNICLDCDKFDKLNSQCSVCGCNINNKKMFLNKLAWADQECPLKKWSKV
jgi:hypothetical protein